MKKAAGNLGREKKVDWSVSAFWTGGYEDTCRWYGKLAQAIGSTRLPFVDTVLALVFGTFAVAITLAIVQGFQPQLPPSILAEPSGGMDTDAEETRS